MSKTENVTNVEMEQTKEAVEVVNTPMGSITLNVHPGANVEIIGITKDVKGRDIPKNPEFGFSISQKLKNGNYSVLASDGVILEIKPDNLRNKK